MPTKRVHLKKETGRHLQHEYLFEDVGSIQNVTKASRALRPQSVWEDCLEKQSMVARFAGK